MYLPGFWTVWQLEGLPCLDCFSGSETVDQILRFPAEYREIPFL
ncbi:unnamed protein product, partial [Brassica oleracea]